MLAYRIRRVQIELQSHRNWLNTFNTAPSRHDFATSPARSFSRSHGRQYEYVSAAKKRKQERKAHRRFGGQNQANSNKQTLNLDTLNARSELAEAIDRSDIAGVMRAYRQLPEKKPLSTDDFYKIAQCAHQCLRWENQKPARSREREATDNIVAFAELLTQDITKNNLMPSTAAHVHLMGLFKESGTKDAGVRFWSWLQTQDDEHVSTEVYAVAIDFLAVNGYPLEDIEELYNTALARFPGSFHAYHLSPEAIVPDREKAIDIKGIPMSLLHSIMLARLLRGESQRAYLALDTAFRLFPTAVPHRSVRTFLDERPISETYTLFAMVYRAGMHLPGLPFKTFVAKLRLTADPASAISQICSLRAMLSTMYLHVGCSGALVSNTVGEFVIALTHILRLPGIAAMENKQRRQVVNSVLAIIRKTSEVFARYGAVPSIPSFNSVIANVAGYGRMKSVVGIVLADMKALGLEPNDVTRRSVMTVNCTLRDKDFVRKSWREIVEARKMQNQRPDIIDLNVMIRAARLSDMADFAEEQANQYRRYLSAEGQSSVDYYLIRPLDETSPDSEGQDQTEDILQGLEKLRADLEVLDERTREKPSVQDFSNQALPTMLLQQPSVLNIDEQAMRGIYDELTTENSSPAAPGTPLVEKDDTAELPKSSTNIHLGTLRYENWKCVNYLLWLAEKHDAEHIAGVDAAIEVGTLPPRREMGLTKAEQENLGSFGLSDAANSAPSTSSEDAVRAARNEILRLRGRVSR